MKSCVLQNWKGAVNIKNTSMVVKSKHVLGEQDQSSNFIQVLKCETAQCCFSLCWVPRYRCYQQIGDSTQEGNAVQIRGAVSRACLLTVP